MPTSRAKSVAARPPARKASANGQCATSHSCRAVSTPMPKNAACPRLTWPAKPPTMFQLSPNVTYSRMRKRRFRTSPRPPASSGTRASPTSPSPMSPSLSKPRPCRDPDPRRDASSASPREEPPRPQQQHPQEQQQADHLLILRTNPDGAEIFHHTE